MPSRAHETLQLAEARDAGERPRILLGRYELTALIGRGGMGAVYRAFDQRDHCECAVKILNQSVSETDDAYRRFVREGEIVAKLFHPHIVDIRDFAIAEDGSPFLVMELLHGQDLHRLTRNQRRLPLSYALEVLSQVGSALEAMHSIGVIHRDVKLQNIFVCSDSRFPERPGGIVKLVDFGLSRSLAGEQITTAGNILGTLEYLCPEGTFGDSAALDEASDLWSLAVVAYRLLSGRLPFQSDNMVSLVMQVRDARPPALSQLVPSLPAHVCEAVHRALAPRREDRYASIADFLQALRQRPRSGAAAAVASHLSQSIPALAPAVSPCSEPSYAELRLELPPPPRATAGVLVRMRSWRPLWFIAPAALLIVLGMISAAKLRRTGGSSRSMQRRGAEQGEPQGQAGVRVERGSRADATLPPVTNLPLSARHEAPPRASTEAPRTVSARRVLSDAGAAAAIIRPKPAADHRYGTAARTVPATIKLPEELDEDLASDKAGKAQAVSTRSLPADDGPAQAAVPAHRTAMRRITGCGPMPEIPLSLRRSLSGRTLRGRYELCLDPRGTVIAVRTLQGIPTADDSIAAVLKTWRCPPWPISSCSVVELEFDLE